MKQLVLASGNAGKLRELAAMLAPLGLELLAQSDLAVPEAAEPYVTFLENALTKARHASRYTGLPALADDSGICVNALQGAPGVHSARFAGAPRSDARNNDHLLQELARSPDRSAYYYCVMVLVRHPDDPQPLVADGLWRGEVLTAPRGTGGFGYDPLFYLPDQGLTAAELDTAVKNDISHRAIAMRALRDQLQRLG